MITQSLKVKTQSYNVKLKTVLSLVLSSVLGYLVFYVLVNNIFAQTFALTYPIAELEYCRDAKECYLYCEIPRNQEACTSYANQNLSSVLGQHTESGDMEEEARKMGITFPITQLGGCSSARECHAYCEQEANRQTCMNFARSRGIGQYKKHQEMMNSLGCSSMDECQSFCQNPENQERCMTVARQHMPEKYREHFEKMNRAKEQLGCSSAESCRAVCESPDNQERCMNFMQQHMPDKFGEFQQKREEMMRKFEDQRGKFEGGLEGEPGRIHDSGNVIIYDQGREDSKQHRQQFEQGDYQQYAPSQQPETDYTQRLETTTPFSTEPAQEPTKTTTP